MRQKLVTIITILTLFTFSVQSISAAQSFAIAPNEIDQLSAFRQVKQIIPQQLAVPTVVEVPFEDVALRDTTMVVIENNNHTVVPSFFVNITTKHDIPYALTDDSDSGRPTRMNDQSYSTYSEYPLPKKGLGQVTIEANSLPMTVSSITLYVDKNVMLPKTVSVTAHPAGQEAVVVLAETPMTSTTVSFPETTAGWWTVHLTYDQPLRITEFKFNQVKVPVTQKKTLRFLAQPNGAYTIYFDPDTTVYLSSNSQSPNLSSITTVQTVVGEPAQKNPLYKPADSDQDGVLDSRDNCPSVSNSDQKDVNHNGQGDTCEDFDVDGVMNNVDNCPNDPNQTQIDSDEDGIGDVCDSRESRFTEAHPWVPWLGIGFAGVVLVVLFTLTARKKV